MLFLVSTVLLTVPSFLSILYSHVNSVIVASGSELHGWGVFPAGTGIFVLTVTSKMSPGPTWPYGPGTDFFFLPRGYRSPFLKLTTYFCLVPSLRMCGVVHPLHHMSPWHGTSFSIGKTLLNVFRSMMYLHKNHSDTNSSFWLQPFMVTKISKIPLRMTAVWGGISKPPFQQLILAVFASETLVDIIPLMQCSAQQHLYWTAVFLPFIHTLRISILAVKQVYLNFYFNIWRSSDN